MNSVGANQYPRSGMSQRDRAPGRALVLAGRDERLDPLELLGRVDRADVGVLVHRVAEAQTAHPLPQLRDHLVAHAFLDQQPRPRAAHVALVEEDSVDDPLDRLVERGVLEHDVRRLAAQLEGQARVRARQRGLDVPSHRGRPGERDLVDSIPAHPADERGAGGAVAGQDRHHARGKVRLLADLGQEQRGQRRRLGRLEDRDVPARQRGRELPRRHQQREVPRHDLAHDPQWLHLASVDAVDELVRPPGVVEEVRRGERDVDVARLAQGLAAVHRLHHRELARALLDQPRDPEQVLGALEVLQRRPLRLRGARGLHRDGHVLGPRVRHLRDRLLGGGVDRRDVPVLERIAEVAVHEQPVALLEPDVVGGLGGRGVIPDDAGARLGGHSFEKSSDRP